MIRNIDVNRLEPADASRTGIPADAPETLPGKIGQIAPGVHRIDTALGERTTSLYLFVGSECALLFDTGIDGTIPGSVLPYARQIGCDLASIDKVVVSHCDVDHCGGAQDVADYLPGATLVAHTLDADAIEDFATLEQHRGRGFRERYGLKENDDATNWRRSVVREAPVGQRMVGGENVDLGDRKLTILHTPGHSRGQLSIHDPDNELVAVSDAVLGDAVPLASGAPAFPPTYRFVGEYLATIELFQALHPALFATAHYGVLADAEIGEFLDLSQKFVERLRGCILNAVSSARHGMTLAELLDDLNPGVGRWPGAGTAIALTFPVIGHIEQLVDEGVLRVRSGNGTARIETAW